MPWSVLGKGGEVRRSQGWLACGGMVLGLALMARSALFHAASRDEADADALDTAPAVLAVRRAGEAIRPLFRRKGPPKPGEWLDKHAEHGQTFDDYRHDDPPRPTRSRTTLYLQPLGPFTAAQGRLKDATADFLGRFYGLPVRIAPPIEAQAIPERARRLNPTTQKPQIHSTFVLDMLKTRRPDDAVAVLALTTEDLWPGEGNFVFGQASLSERVGVWSVHRFGNPETEFPLCLTRTLDTAAHETGHMFGILHCIAYECGMNGSNHLVEADSQPMAFCPEDEMKVWWACRLDPLARYDRLASFADAHGLVAEAKGWRAARSLLSKRTGTGRLNRG